MIVIGRTICLFIGEGKRKIVDDICWKDEEILSNCSGRIGISYATESEDVEDLSSIIDTWNIWDC